MIEVYKQDPFVHDKLSMQLARDILIHADNMIGLRAKITFPIICLHSPEDKLTCYKASETFFNGIGSKDCIFKAMNGMAHECRIKYIFKLICSTQ